MRKKLFFLFLVFYAVSALFAQDPVIQWQKTIGGDQYDAIRSIRQTTDGGYILGGTSNSGISGNKTQSNRGTSDYWVVKLDGNGSMQWQKALGGAGYDYFPDVQPTFDGGYLVGGYSDSNASGDKTENGWGNFDYWVLKLDSVGSIQWQKTIGGSGYDQLQAVQPTPDGGYLLGGTSDSDSSGNKTENGWGGTDFWLVKLAANGDMQWQKSIGGSKFDRFQNIQPTTGGGYLIGGSSESDISGDKTENSLGSSDYWLLKLDSAGLIQWQKTVGGGSTEHLQSVVETADHGYIVGGSSFSDASGHKTENGVGGGDYWIVKLNASGAIQWENTIGTDLFDQPISIHETVQGNYLVSGNTYYGVSGDKTEPGIGKHDIWLMQLDTAGNIEWQKNLGGSNADALTAMLQTVDGGYIIGASSESNISGDKSEYCFGDLDYWVIKLFPQLVPAMEPVAAPASLELFPNPTTDAVFVRTNVRTDLHLYNAVGQMIATQTVQDGDKMDLSTLPTGLYFLIETTTGQAHKVWKNK